MALKQQQDALNQHQANIMRDKLYAEIMAQQALQKENGLLDDTKRENIEPVIDKSKDSNKKKKKQNQPEIPPVVTAEQIKSAEDAADKFLKELDIEEDKNKQNNNNKKNNKKNNNNKKK